MPQKEARARTSAGGPGVPNRAAPRRSPRLRSLPEDSGGATTGSSRIPSLGAAGEAGPASGDGATPRGRSSRCRSSVECRGGAGSAGWVAATPCRRSARLLSRGGHGGEIAGPPDSKREGGHSARSRRQGLQISALRRSSRLAKSAVESGGDATGGGGPEGDCRRRSARSRGSIGMGLTGEIESGSGLDEKGGNLGREKKVTKKGVFEIPKGPGRPEVESAVSKESGSDVDVDKRRKSMEIHVAPVTDGRRDKKRKQTMEAQEELVLERRDFAGGSGCPESGSDVDVDKRKKRMEIPWVPVTKGRRDKKRKQTREAQEELVLEKRDFAGDSGCPASGSDVDVDKRKKRMEIPVVPVTEGRRDKKRKQTRETQEKLVLERRDFEGGSGCPEWTNEQEIALHRAYILAKPSPRFWKKVAKLVPGKSAQECFDKIHSKIVTPVPIQPRSRSKTIDCPPLGFNDLLREGTRRSKCSKRKNLLLPHKTARHILRKHSIMDHGQEADLFSILETSPNMHADLSQIKMPWSPGCITVSPQLHQRSIENLSSGHKKAHSRFKSQAPVRYASPEVLKPVKNIVLHEKYIDELHYREARRRMCNKTACSVGAEDKENAILKDDIVRAAKNALVSEAKGIMGRLGHAQSSPSSNSLDTYDCEDECEEDI